MLSPPAEAYDRGGKFSHYRKIAALREYLMVTQDQPSIECYLRQELCSQSDRSLRHSSK
ncbi:MAG: Uma2 family endonuclease [Methylococcales bacterium]|nr:Uma2 family endonuclease [Methylococcales bacterium]